MVHIVLGECSHGMRLSAKLHIAFVWVAVPDIVIVGLQCILQHVACQLDMNASQLWDALLGMTLSNS